MAVVRVFLDTNMGLGIPGLNALLKENRVGAAAASSDTMFMFLNRKRTQVKILWDQRLMLHFRKEDGAITIEELKRIPNYFKQRLLSDKIEKQLSTYIDRSVHLTLDEDGVKISS